MNNNIKRNVASFLLIAITILGLQRTVAAQVSCSMQTLGCVNTPEIQARLVRNANNIRSMTSDQQRQLAVDLGLIFENDINDKSDKTTSEFRGPLLVYNAKSCGSASVVSAHAAMIESAIYQLLGK